MGVLRSDKVCEAICTFHRGIITPLPTHDSVITAVPEIDNVPLILPSSNNVDVKRDAVES